MDSWVREQISVYLQFGARVEWEEPRDGVGGAELESWLLSFWKI